MIKKEIIEIPRGIEYISQWSEYAIPRGEHCIVDKGVTGCGYTEYRENYFLRIKTSNIKRMIIYYILRIMEIILLIKE